MVDGMDGRDLSVVGWNVCEGPDAVIFTGGIGEKSAEIRERILKPLNFAGIEIDFEKNRENAFCITKDASKIKAYIIATNEELMIAKQAFLMIRTLNSV